MNSPVRAFPPLSCSPNACLRIRLFSTAICRGRGTRSTQPARHAIPCSPRWSNTTSTAILEGPKDNIRETEHNFNAAQTFEEWMPIGMVGETSKHLTTGVSRAFARIKGAISHDDGAPLGVPHAHPIHLYNGSVKLLPRDPGQGCHLTPARSKPGAGHWSPSSFGLCFKISTRFTCLGKSLATSRMNRHVSMPCSCMWLWRN